MCWSMMDSDRPPAIPTSTASFYFLNDANEVKDRENSISARTHRADEKKDSLAPSMESSSGRLQRIDLLKRYLEQQDSSVAKLAVENLQFSSDSYGMNMLFDKDAKNKNKSGCGALNQYLAYLHKKFGLRHILLLLLLIGYTVIGGLIFDAIERPHEAQNLQRMYKVLMQRIDNTSEEIISLVLSSDFQMNRKEKVDLIIKKFYMGMLDLEGRLSNSVFDKADNDNNRLVWNFGSAVFYSTALYTTTGYGTIVCATIWGKALSVIYATIGIPLILVVLNDLGRVLFFALQKIYNHVYRMCRKSRTCGNIEEKGESEEHTFPLRIAIPLAVFYVLLCSLVVHVSDYQLHGEYEKGLQFGDSFYFTFISMTTIGLGDLMPVHIQYSPFVAAMFMFGLVLFSVIMNTVYARMERNYIRAMETMETVLDELHTDKVDGGNHGYRVFRMLSDAICLLALTVPELEEENGEGWRRLSTIRDSLRTNLAARRLRIKGQCTSSINSLVALGAMGAVRQFSEFEETKKAKIQRSKAISRSDTDLFSIERHVQNADVYSTRPLGLRFHLDTVRARAMSELIQERARAYILRTRITSRSDASLLFVPPRRSLSHRIDASFRRVELSSDL